MKTHYLLFALLTLGIPGMALAQETPNHGNEVCNCTQVDNSCTCPTQTCSCKEGKTTDDEQLIPRSPLQRAVIHAGQQRGKARAQKLAKKESLPLLKKSYRESSIGRRAPDQFALYYKAYKRGYLQLLTQDASGYAKELGTESAP